METMTARTRWSYIVSRAGLFILLWWILTNGESASWWIGVPAVLLAITVSITMVPSILFVWSELLRFIPFFLLHSLLGAIDVARCAFRPKMPIAPDLFEYPMRLPAGLPQVLMANTVGLLPGTLSTELKSNILTVHVLDKETDFLAELEAVERSVARMFGQPLIDSNKVD